MKHVWAAQRVGVAIALRTCPSSYNRSYSSHSNFLCKVCVSANYCSELRRCAKVVISMIVCSYSYVCVATVGVLCCRKTLIAVFAANISCITPTV